MNGKTGFALTSKRVLWKLMWENPVSIHLKELTPEKVRVEDTRLIVDDQSVDIADRSVAESLAGVIVELTLAVNR